MTQEGQTNFTQVETSELGDRIGNLKDILLKAAATFAIGVAGALAIYTLSTPEGAPLIPAIIRNPLGLIPAFGGGAIAADSIVNAWMRRVHGTPSQGFEDTGEFYT